MDERFYWLGWAVFPGVGPGKFRLLLDHFKSAKETWDADQPELKNIIGEKLSLDFEEFRKTFSIENYLKKLEEKNVWFLTQKDKEYPQLLLQIDKPPILLFGKGKIDYISGSCQSFSSPEKSTDRLTHVSNDAQRALSRSSTLSSSSLNESRSPKSINKSDIGNGSTFSSFETYDQSSSSRTIAVVGTRKMTHYGREVTEILTRDLVRAGFVIVSGLAMGVDTVSHKTAIENGGKTIAVLGCGVDLCYPSSNKKLYDEIINRNGAVVSEFPIGMTPSVGSFPSRNRIIAGLSVGVLVTEGAQDSGSLITADYAIKYKRKVFAVPGPITSGLSRGPSKLIQRGAKLVTRSNDILEELVDGMSLIRDMGDMSLMGKNSKSIKGDSEEENRILEILENEPLHFDEIVRKSGYDPSKTGSVLTILEIKGIIKSLENGTFSIVS